MLATSTSTFAGTLGRRRRQVPVMITVIVAAFSIISSIQLVHCQGFEDLNKQHNTFQPQPQLQPSNQRGFRHSFQRPVLSNRFGSGQQQLSAQASSSATTFSDPPQATLVATSATPGQQGVSNIEQMMKNALARTAQLNSAAESRADVGGETLAPKVSAAFQRQQHQQQETTVADRQSEASESTADTKSPPPSSPAQESSSSQQQDEQTTTATTTTNGHETVYSDQRFANLFARRNQLKKSRLQPTEQVKAKPTLPSFIKSLPDPKQFSTNQAATQDSKPAPSSSSSSNSFASQRLQQQGRLQNTGPNLGAANKKPVITSTSAANANNKRAAVQANQKLNAASSAPKPSAALKATTSKPTGLASNNPFSRSQASSSSDPANVIAMARKRLLANNALESAKLKQQQSNKQQANN